MSQAILCSDCFTDEGLKIDAQNIGIDEDTECPNCRAEEGKKLDERLLAILAHRFFVRGTLHRTQFGGAPVVQFNEHQDTSINPPSWLEADVELIGDALGVGFFHYGPRLWMVGEIEPLKSLQKESERKDVIARILSEYPDATLSDDDVFYRLRLDPDNPTEEREYDSPPDQYCGTGRLDTENLPVMYASQDVQVCIHECRASVEDDLYIASIKPRQELKLLDLTDLLDEDTTEFESLDLAIHMLFLAGDHSYDISRDISISAVEKGYDGVIYPSYYSLLRTGSMPFDTVYGISIRQIDQLYKSAKSQLIRNIAIFGRPISDSRVNVKCINRIVLNRVEYDVCFGPPDY